MALITALERNDPQQASLVHTGDGLRVGPADPTADDRGAREAAVRGTAQDMYFFTSIEDYPAGIGDLPLPHDDVQGFHDYVKRFNTPNGWYRDGSVGQWIYEETYDNYLDDYGFDSSCVVYHAGHGDMDSAGVFWVPMGNSWGGDSWTSSRDMRLGNEFARYVFWSTCLSLRVKGGHTPVRTWSVANLGLRMIFGYETLMVDHAGYGRIFFDEWNKNKSLSTAFLDASWRISTGQEPAAVACGATQSEASSRVFNERFFYTGRASTSWWWWRWYDAARGRQRNLDRPERTTSARLASPLDSVQELGQQADRFGFRLPEGADERELLRGAALEVDGRIMAIGPDGSREFVLAETAETSRQLPAEEAVQAATRAVEEFGLAQDVDLVFDHTRFDRHAGASADEQVDESVRETTVVFAQVIDGLPVVTPDSGHVHVRVDNDGTITGVVDGTRQVLDVRDQAATPPDPESRTHQRGSAGDPAEPADEPEHDDRATVDDLLQAALQNRLRSVAAGGHVPTSVRVVPESSEIGYAFRDGDAVLVARQEVEIDFGQGLAKRYILQEPLPG